MSVAAKRSAGPLTVGIVVIATLLALAPAANADAPVSRDVAPGCIGLSLNIIDLPYNGGVVVRTDPRQPGLITIIGGSNSTTRYLSDATITITNETTNASGTTHRRYVHTRGGSVGGGYIIPDIYTGPGRISITITAINHGLMALSAPRCHGTVFVR